MFTRLTAADGHVLDCWMQEAEGTAKGRLVILQEIFGVTDQLKDVAARYAASGFHVAIPALFDRQRPGTVVPFDQAPVGRDLMLSADLDQVMADVAAAVAALASKGVKVAVMGFCWGGGLAIAAAQRLDIACAVSFYGTRLPTLMDRPLRVPVQGHFGDADDHAPLEVLDKARAAWPELDLHLYQAGHAFANDRRAAVYVPEAAEQAHARSTEFLAAHLA